METHEPTISATITYQGVSYEPAALREGDVAACQPLLEVARPYLDALAVTIRKEYTRRSSTRPCFTACNPPNRQRRRREHAE